MGPRRPPKSLFFWSQKWHFPDFPFRGSVSEGPKGGAGVKGAGVANCRIFRSAVPSVVVWSVLLVSL